MSMNLAPPQNFNEYNGDWLMFRRQYAMNIYQQAPNDTSLAQIVPNDFRLEADVVQVGHLIFGSVGHEGAHSTTSNKDHLIIAWQPLPSIPGDDSEAPRLDCVAIFSHMLWLGYLMAGVEYE